MLFAQRFRDATLADAVLENNTGEGAILIAGIGHSRNDYGVPFYLRFREPLANISTVIPLMENEFNYLRERSELKNVPCEYIWVFSKADGINLAVASGS